MKTGPVPAGAPGKPGAPMAPDLDVETGRIRLWISLLVAVAALLFPPCGLPAVGLVQAARRAIAAHDYAGAASAMRRARCWAFAAVLAAVLAVPAGVIVWVRTTTTCVCISSTFEPD